MEDNKSLTGEGTPHSGLIESPTPDVKSEQDAQVSPEDKKNTHKPILPPELDPREWPSRKKWTNLTLIAAQATLVPICSGILAVAAEQIDAELRITNSHVSALPVALYVLGLGIGPLYLAPLSELFGRRIIYIVFFAIFALLNVGCALVHNAPGLIILRFLAGVAGSAGPTLGGGTIADMFKPHERGGAQALYSFGPTVGPAIGGLIGGYIADRAGWRWQMWTMAISAGTTSAMCVFFLHETYGPYILARTEGKRHAPAKLGFVHAFTRPIRMLLFAPIATAMAMYISIVYGVLYLHIVTIPLLFGPQSVAGLFTYGWKDGNEGLAYLGIGIGAYLSIFTCILTLNRNYRYFCNKYGSQKPEFRLPMMQLGMLIIPAGLFMYGWSAQAHTHFIVPLLGAAIFAIGFLIAYICMQTYMIDTFGQYAASALAATVLLRSIFGMIFAIFGEQLYTKLDYGWGTSVLAFIAISALPIPSVLWIYGERLRAHPFII